VNRRSFLASSLGAGIGHIWAQSSPLPIIDTHIHLFDPTRPEGVPWPPKTNTVVYKKTLPSRLREVSAGLNVVGAIEVECSPWVKDNDWVLNVAKDDPLIVGMVGNLEPDKPEFRRQLDRYAANPLFRGIRYGYLWDRSLRAALAKPEFVAGLKELAKRDLSLDTANPSIELLQDVVTISDKVPELRVVIDHLPALLIKPSENPELPRLYREFAKRKNVFVKMSAVLRGDEKSPVSYELKDHKDRLDRIYEAFGPDRVMYGSDWPNSDPTANYKQVLSIVQQYFGSKGREVQEKCFWRNSATVYKWKPRDASQPKLASFAMGSTEVA
jgi:L-fuconolactonase